MRKSIAEPFDILEQTSGESSASEILQANLRKTVGKPSGSLSRNLTEIIRILFGKLSETRVNALGILRDTFGEPFAKPLENHWKTSLGNHRETWAKPLANLTKILCEPMGNLWQTVGNSLGNLWKTVGKTSTNLWGRFGENLRGPSLNLHEASWDVRVSKFWKMLENMKV